MDFHILLFLTKKFLLTPRLLLDWFRTFEYFYNANCDGNALAIGSPSKKIWEESNFVAGITAFLVLGPNLVTRL